MVYKVCATYRLYDTSWSATAPGSPVLVFLYHLYHFLPSHIFHIKVLMLVVGSECPSPFVLRRKAPFRLSRMLLPRGGIVVAAAWCGGGSVDGRARYPSHIIPPRTRGRCGARGWPTVPGAARIESSRGAAHRCRVGQSRVSAPAGARPVTSPGAFPRWGSLGRHE